VPVVEEAEVALRAWCDHVVHVHLYSRDEELSQTCARFLGQRFADRDVDATAEPGYVEVRSSLEAPVTAADVAQALVVAQVRASSVFDRPEWSVAEL
jgi:Asp-tRNA(Asn)/Glu-tRNA(Gln) amidotransferase B subunit